MKTKTKYLDLAIYVIGLIGAVYIMAAYFDDQTAFNGLAGGSQTARVHGLMAGHLIEEEDLNEENVADILAGWEKRGKRPVVFVVGNSQSHSINQPKDGEVCFPQLIAEGIDSLGYDVIGTTMPNGNLQEMWLWFEFWKKKLPIKHVMIPAFFDDMRENEVRSMFLSQVIREKFQIPVTGKIADKINTTLAESKDVNNVDKEDVAALDLTTQEKVETYLNDKLAEQGEGWTRRAEVRGRLFTWLYRLRNSVLGINPSSIRKSIPFTSANNMEALNGMIASIKEMNATCLLYVPPICQEEQIPYDLTEYGAFKTELEELAAPDFMDFINIEADVPVILWGTKESSSLSPEPERDFMHFQYKGHQIVAEKLLPLIINRISKRDTL